jgi:hypothetical protein
MWWIVLIRFKLDNNLFIITLFLFLTRILLYVINPQLEQTKYLPKPTIIACFKMKVSGCPF